MSVDAGSDSGTERWWHRPFSVFQTNLQEIDATLDVDATLDYIEDYGADTWLLSTGGIVSFHPSDLPFQSPSPHLADRPTGDLVGDAVRAAHERGIRIIARCDFSKVSSRIASEHPEWLYVSPEGQPQVYNTLYSVCPSGQYYQERTIDILDEIIDRYPVDGFFFNWLNFNERDYSRRYIGVCHCQSCHHRYGRELPARPESDGYWDWIAFSFATTGALTARIGQHIASRRPDAALVLRRGASIAYQEASNAFQADVWHHETGEAVSAQVTASPDVPVMVNSVSFIDMPYRMAGEQPERFAQYLVQAIARGGNPSTYIMGAPGRIPYANLQQGREITRFHRRHRALYEQLESVATTALVRPNRFGMRPHLYAKTVEEYRGVHASLQQTHRPFDVLAVESIAQMADDRRLARYRCIVLPDLGPLGPAAARSLDDFVAAGGHLVLTGSSGLAEDGTVELASSPARLGHGSPLADAELWSTYATVDPQPGIDEYIYAASVVPIYGACQRFVWKPGATRIGSLLPAAPFGPPELCYGHALGGDPAVARFDTGLGSTTVIPWSIGRTYREVGTTEVRSMLIAALPGTDDRIMASLPEQVELVSGRVSDSYVMHLLNHSGARHRTFGPHLTVSGGQIRLVDMQPQQAAALVSGQPVGIRSDGDDAILDLPPLELFEVIRVPFPSDAPPTRPMEE